MSGRFSKQLLAELKAAVPVIDAVRRRHKMRKAGSAEWKAVDDESLSVNTIKNIWNDFGKGDRGGDVFEWEMFTTGCTFEQAVQNVAEFAGVLLPNGGAAHGPRQEPPTPEPNDYGTNFTSEPQREITATYDYCDADGTLIYQVCRRDWVEDGKRKKSFLQRRPHGGIVDGQPEAWIWGLSEGVYLRRARDGDYYPANKHRLETWKDAERIEVEACPHMLYRLPQLREELAQEPGERHIVFIVEGERDCETLVAWNLVATTNSGGAGNWRAEHAAELQDADVVIIEDHDAAGRRRGETIATSLIGVAKSVRLVRWPEHWSTCPPGGDVTDWRGQDGGDADRLLAIVDKLPPRTPTDSSGWTFHGAAPQSNPRWTVKGIIPESGVGLLGGQWGYSRRRSRSTSRRR